MDVRAWIALCAPNAPRDSLLARYTLEYSSSIVLIVFVRPIPERSRGNMKFLPSHLDI
jgi:hypothetical protein